MTLNEQESLALSACPNGGYACIVINNKEWELNTTFAYNRDALKWFDEEPRGARVFKISHGQVSIHCAK